MTLVSTKNVSRIAETIEAIVSSPLVIYYNVGITLNPQTRRIPYASSAPYYRHFVILETGLSSVEAIELERTLFNKIVAYDKRCFSYRKYAPVRRDAPYKASLGGKRAQNDGVYVFYIAWRSE